MTKKGKWKIPYEEKDPDTCVWYEVILDDGRNDTACIMYPRGYKNNTGKYTPGEWYKFKNDDEMDKIDGNVLYFYTRDVGSIYAMNYEGFW